jgi:hypothetical protein
MKIPFTLTLSQRERGIFREGKSGDCHPQSLK